MNCMKCWVLFVCVCAMCLGLLLQAYNEGGWLQLVKVLALSGVAFGAIYVIILHARKQV